MTDRSLAIRRARLPRPGVVTNEHSGNHLLSRYRDADEAPMFEEPDPVLVALEEGSNTEIRAKPSYAELEREVYALREKVKMLSDALTQKTMELEAAPPSVRSSPSLPPSSVRSSPSLPPVSARASSSLPPPSSRSSLAPQRMSATSLAPPRLSSPSFALAPGVSVFRSLALTVIDAEQRDHSRMPCNLEVEFTVESEFYTGITQDLSQGGLFVVTYCVLPLDTQLSLRIELRTGEILEVTGRVRWIRQPVSDATRPGMGIEFVDLPEHAVESIQRSCRGREPLFFDIAALAERP